VFTNEAGKATSAVVTLTVNAEEPPVITQQPKNAEVTEGEEASFEATASGVPSPTVQWEESTNKGGSFAPVSGATSDTLKVPGTMVSESGDEYRAVFTSKAGTATSDPVTLTVKARPTQAPVVTKQPVSMEVTEGEEAKFEAAASGVPVPTVQWEESTNGGASFSEASGATSKTMRIFNTRASESGDEYRAVFTNEVGPNEVREATSNAVILKVKAKPTSEPPKEAAQEAALVSPLPGPTSGVLGVKEEQPVATVAGTSLSVSSSGAFKMKLGCSGTNVTHCEGNVTLKTLTAVRTSKRKASILIVATGSYSVTAGQATTVALHLSSGARALLAKRHTLRVRVTIVARDPTGGSHTATTVLTLRLAKKSHR
jgi:hypothetical protein